MKASKSLRFIAIIGLVATVTYQLTIVFGDYAILWAKRTYRTITLPSMERNAIFLFGGKGARFMKHISRTVPFDKPVVIPEGYGEFSSQNILQFFLMPRGIPGCGCREYLQYETISEDCRACLLKDDHFIPAIGKFPPHDLLASSKEFIPFQDSDWYRGIYVPPNSERNASPNLYIEMHMPLPLAAALDFMGLLLMLSLGASIAHELDGNLAISEYIALALPLGMGLITWPMFLLSWLGLAKVSLTSFLVLIGILHICAILIKLCRRRQLRIPHFHKPVLAQISNLAHDPPAAMALIAILIVWGFSFAISIGRGYSLFDGIANWALKGYGIALEGTVFAGRQWGGHSLSYPQNIHLAIAFFRLLDGDVLPGSKAIFPLFGASILAGFYSLMRRFQIERALAMVGGMLILSIPFVFFHTTIGWGNLVFAGYVILACYFMTQAACFGDVGKYRVGGLLLAFSAWTRPEGIGYAIAIIVLFLLTGIRVRPRTRGTWIIPTIVVAGTWIAFSAASMASDEIGGTLASFISSIRAGRLDFGSLSLIMDYAMNEWSKIGIWGLMIYLIPGLLAVAVARKRLARPMPALVLAGCGIVCIGIPLFMFFVASFDKGDMGIFLWASFNRAQIQGIVLLYSSLFLASLAGGADLVRQEPKRIQRSGEG